MSHCIWGQIIATYNLTRGVRAVLTDSHEGLLLSKKWAEDKLPKEALKNIPFSAGCYHFEGDTEQYIPQFFRPELIVRFVEEQFPDATRQRKQNCLKNYFGLTYKGMKKCHPWLLEQFSQQEDSFKFYGRTTVQMSEKEFDEFVNQGAE